MIACNACQNQIVELGPYVIHPMHGAPTLHWHVGCYPVAPPPKPTEDP